MAGKPWEEKEVPWCTICLVVAIVICQGLVLLGNMQFASASNDIGVSTSGWSGVGLALSVSVRGELDEIMSNVTGVISDSLNKTLQASDLIDLLVGLTGQATDAVVESNATKAAFLLQQASVVNAKQNGRDLPSISAITGTVLGTVDQLIDNLMHKVVEALDHLLTVITPALIQVGSFILQFGDKVQAMLSTFSVTLDKAQKTFDSVMSSLSSKGDGFDDLEYNTWSLFDFHGTGKATAEMVQACAQTYGISALQGSKATQIVEEYDVDGDGALDEAEFIQAQYDDSIPDIMSVALRSFSSSLSEVSGQMAQAVYRDEVAQAVVAYLNLMGAKNMTKVYWVSDRLTNASTPTSFTSDVMYELAMQMEDENYMSTVPVGQLGQIVIDAMLYMNKEYTIECWHQLSDPAYWTEEGYNFEDQPTVVAQVTHWVTNSDNFFSQPSEEETAPTEGDKTTMTAPTESDKTTMIMLEQEVIDAMPAVAKELVEKRAKAHLKQKLDAKQARYNQLYESKTAQKLRLHLLGGKSVSNTHEPMSLAEQAINAGALAVPATLEFAKFLSWNATQTANRFQGYAFSYTATSSNSIDGFAQIIEGMVKKIQAFIDQMEDYSTPSGIQDLEDKVMNFAKKGLEDVSGIIKSTLSDAVASVGPDLDDAIEGAIYEAGETLGAMIGGIIGTPLATAMEPVIEEILSSLLGNTTSDAIDELGETLSGMVGSTIENVAADKLGGLIGDALTDLLTKALEALSDKLDIAASHSLVQVNMAKQLGPFHLNHGKHNKNTADPKEVAAFTAKLEHAVDLSRRAAELKAASKRGEVVDSAALRLEIKALRRQLREERLPLVHKVASGCRRHQGKCELKGTAALISQAEDELELERDSPNSTNSTNSTSVDLTSGVWGTLIQLLTSLTNLLPLAVDNLKFARTEVSSLAENLDSIFTLFDENGPPIFDSVAGLWRIIWIGYFCFMGPLNFIMLFYGLWAGGYFGGPGAAPKEEPEDPNKYRGIMGKCHACCDACCSCIRNCHDTTICFWSILILLQIFGLVLFLISIVFVLFAAIKIFIAAGCASIYMLGDETICGDTLGLLRGFLASFLGSYADDEMSAYCNDSQLLMCEMIGEKMQMSGIWCVAGAFGSCILTFQLLIESAVLHTRAVERRRLAYMFSDKK